MKEKVRHYQMYQPRTKNTNLNKEKEANLSTWCHHNQGKGDT